MFSFYSAELMLPRFVQDVRGKDRRCQVLLATLGQSGAQEHSNQPGTKEPQPHSGHVSCGLIVRRVPGANPELRRGPLEEAGFLASTQQVSQWLSEKDGFM